MSLEYTSILIENILAKALDIKEPADLTGRRAK
jgi:hypothetical protein